MNKERRKREFILKNPFQPTGILSLPGEFFGRLDETQRLERSLYQGSIVITGAMGVGKSSLLEHFRLHMEGFDSEENGKRAKAKTVVATGISDIKTVDDVARLLLQEFVRIDEKKKTIEVKIPKIELIKWSSTEIYRYFKEGHHLSVLTRILKDETLKTHLTEETNYFILAFDEADKCPKPLAGFIKALDTTLGHEGINNIRFIVTGISPFFEEMVKEASGVKRIFYDKLPVLPFQDEEASALLEDKFKKLIQDARDLGIEIEIEPIVFELILKISGNLPQLIQELGSYVVEKENNDPDNKIDSKDLQGALQTICYEKRGTYYHDLIHKLELAGVLESFKRLLYSVKKKPPTIIELDNARVIVEDETLQWLVEHDVLSSNGAQYRLNDELLQVRIMMDEDKKSAEEIERNLITGGSFLEEEEGWPESWQERRDEEYE